MVPYPDDLDTFVHNSFDDRLSKVDSLEENLKFQTKKLNHPKYGEARPPMIALLQRERMLLEVYTNPRRLRHQAFCSTLHRPLNTRFKTHLFLFVRGTFRQKLLNSDCLQVLPRVTLDRTSNQNHPDSDYCRSLILSQDLVPCNLPQRMPSRIPNPYWNPLPLQSSWQSS